MSLFGISMMKYHGAGTLQWCPPVNWNGYSLLIVIIAYIFLFLLVPPFIMAYKSSDGCRYNGF